VLTQYIFNRNSYDVIKSGKILHKNLSFGYIQSVKNCLFIYKLLNYINFIL